MVTENWVVWKRGREHVLSKINGEHSIRPFPGTFLFSFRSRYTVENVPLQICSSVHSSSSFSVIISIIKANFIFLEGREMNLINNCLVLGKASEKLKTR